MRRTIAGSEHQLTTTMTPEEQRIAIAEACGWTFHPPPYNPPPHSVEFKAEALACWVKPGNPPHQKGFPPDYLNDLNAMHEAEWTLSSEQHATFREKLKEIQSLTAGVYRDYERAYVSAPAEDRAEAFLRTIGKWKD